MCLPRRDQVVRVDRLHEAAHVLVPLCDRISVTFICRRDRRVASLPSVQSVPVHKQCGNGTYGVIGQLPCKDPRVGREALDHSPGVVLERAANGHVREKLAVPARVGASVNTRLGGFKQRIVR